MLPAPPNGKTIWVLADDRAGNRAQCLGVAEKLKLQFTIKEIRYNRLVKLPNILRGANLIGIDPAPRKKLKAPWPDIVISAGRRTAPVARYIKKKNPKAKLVHLMWPDVKPAAFDCIVLPTHDREHGIVGEGKKAKDASNILRTLGAPHRITPQELANIGAEWEPRFAKQQSPRIVLLIGGSTKHGEFATTDYAALGQLAHKAAEIHNGSLLITTSRRTGEAGEQAIMEQVADTLHHLHSWQDKDAENPYMAYLALADAIFVTADSISMCSEACATGKPVFIYSPKGLAGKHARFVNTLIATGYAFPLEEGFLRELRAPMKKAPLDSAATIAEHIRNNLL